jgi:hypothetical protein
LVELVPSERAEDRAVSAADEQLVHVEPVPEKGGGASIDADNPPFVPFAMLDDKRPAGGGEASADELVRWLRIYRRAPADSTATSGAKLEDVLELRPVRPGRRPRRWRHHPPPT